MAKAVSLDLVEANLDDASGELAAVYVHAGKRKGLRIQVKPDQTRLFENNIRQEAQC